jgi:hypothetical protein
MDDGGPLFVASLLFCLLLFVISSHGLFNDSCSDFAAAPNAAIIKGYEKPQIGFVLFWENLFCNARAGIACL